MRRSAVGFVLGVLWIASLNVAVRKGYAAGVQRGRRSILTGSGGMGERHR